MLLTDLFLLKQWPYEHACQSPKAPLWAMGSLLSTGVLFGVLIGLFQRALGGDIQGVPVNQIPTGILFGGNLISGILITLVFHGGVTLVVWLMARAVGGPGQLTSLYRATAYLFPLALPALPKLALSNAAQGRDVALDVSSGLYTVLAWVGLILVLGGLYQLLQVTQRVGPGRTAAAVFLIVLFCFSVLLISS
jgi:hypothetical protein